MSEGIPPQMLDYFATRERQRNEDIDERLSQFTRREWSLMREAAVMGYVQGTMHLKGEPHPKDTPVFRGVVYACMTQSDLYPVISGRVDQYSEPEGEQ
ncbi:hypothetical protein [Streptomyces sp. NPDC058664]|uniref:hypothetical protein n=1 Tax=unclassified Streptomyces TaxID=2593676 RepID=UPI00364A0A8F